MLKVSLSLHDPIDIYDYLKNAYGTFQMQIKKNCALMRFRDSAAIKDILDNPTRTIKGLPLTIKLYEGEDEVKRKITEPSSTNLTSTERMDSQAFANHFSQSLLLGDAIQLPNINAKVQRLGRQYDAKINQFKKLFPDSDQCNSKITQFNNYITKYLKMNSSMFYKPYNDIINSMKNYSNNRQNNAIDLEPDFFAGSARISRERQSNLIQNIPRRSLFNPIPKFTQGVHYSSFGASQAKRICKLNETDFICSLKNDKRSNAGQLRVYRKNDIPPKYTLNIQQGPYSLLVHQNYILTGDYQGQIHFIDLEYENMCSYSNRLVQGLIVQMQHFSLQKNNVPTILTLSSGSRNDYKIKCFEIQNEKISQQLSSLSFFPGQQILCQGITMSMQVLGDGKFAYGCGRNTYICPSFNKSERQYITHEQNVMKIKKRNNHQIVQATQIKILLSDLRSIKIKNQLFDFQYLLNNIQIYNQNYVFYGGQSGQVGIIDIRKPKSHIWSPLHNVHTAKISGILKMQNNIITCDNTGIICQWKNQ